MKVGISQSNYIPWRGYFDFIDDVDLFIFYDDVQYSHRTWRNRNQVKAANGLLWLSVPVAHSHDTLIQDARISYDARWVQKHMRTLSLAYLRAPYLQPYLAEFAGLLDRKFETISQLNVAVCRWVMDKLSIRTRTMMSSELTAKGDKFERPLRILREVGATAYLSGPTARPYTDSTRFREAGIGLEFKTYSYGAYPQLHGDFAGTVSVLDLLFNTGPLARSHLKSNLPNEVVLQVPVS